MHTIADIIPKNGQIESGTEDGSDQEPSAGLESPLIQPENQPMSSQANFNPTLPNTMADTTLIRQALILSRFNPQLLHPLLRSYHANQAVQSSQIQQARVSELQSEINITKSKITYMAHRL